MKQGSRTLRDTFARVARKKAYRRRYYLKHRAKELALMAAWRRANPERHEYARRTSVLRAMGLTMDQAAVVLKKQRGACAICKRKPHGSLKLHLDHNHKTRKARGYLCARCNQGIGMFADDVSVLRSAARYLARFA